METIVVQPSNDEELKLLKEFLQQMNSLSNCKCKIQFIFDLWKELN